MAHIIICGGCGEKKEYFAKGMCEPCYQASYREAKKDKALTETIVCVALDCENEVRRTRIRRMYCSRRCGQRHAQGADKPKEIRVCKEWDCENEFIANTPWQRSCSSACQRRAAGQFWKEKAFNHYGHLCNQCGFGDRRILQFHHRNGRTMSESTVPFIKRLRKSGWPRDECEVLCPNCHAYVHLEQ